MNKILISTLPLYISKNNKKNGSIINSVGEVSLVLFFNI